MNGAEGLPLIESAATSSKAAPILAKNLAQPTGAPLAADDATDVCFLDANRTQRNAGLLEQDPQANAIMKAAILADKYQAIPGTPGKNQGHSWQGCCNTGGIGQAFGGTPQAPGVAFSAK